MHPDPDLNRDQRNADRPADAKVRYRGLFKNELHLFSQFALVNLYQHRNRLAPQRA